MIFKLVRKSIFEQIKVFDVKVISFRFVVLITLHLHTLTPLIFFSCAKDLDKYLGSFELNFEF